MKVDKSFIQFRCPVCDEMPEIAYAGLEGSLPLLITRCACGDHPLRIFNRCEGFPLQPAA